MILYHNSKEKHSILKPIIGSSRHSGEDDKAVNQHVVWLTDGSKDLTIENGKVAAIYQHEIEVDDDDTNLFVDKNKAKLDSEMDKLFGHKGSKWYFYTKDLKVKTIRKWDKNTESFI